MSTGQHYYNHYGPPVYRPEPKNAFGIVALVAALVGIIPGLMPITSFFAVMFGLVAVVFGLLGLGRLSTGVATNKGVTRAGLILGVLVITFGIWGITLFFGAFDKLDKDLKNIGAPAAQPVTTVKTLPAGQYGDGTYAVGTDIQPGTYRTAGADPSAIVPNCYWARMRDTSGEFKSVIANSNQKGPTTVTIKSSDGAFKSQGCQPWVKVK